MRASAKGKQVTVECARDTIAKLSRGGAETRIALAEVETRIASAVGRALNRRLISSNDGNPLQTGDGVVS